MILKVIIIVLIELFPFSLCLNENRIRFGLTTGGFSRITAFQDVAGNFLKTLSNTNQNIPIEQDVTFWCVNPNQPILKQVFLKDDSSISLGVNASIPLSFIIHGWLDHVNVHWINDVVKDYIRYVNTNVCVIDWKRLSQNTPYLTAQNIDRVAVYTADFLKYLIIRGFTYKDITMVGFSFGAHIAGIAGHLLNGQIHKIIGLDPAGIFITTFSKRTKKQRLDKSSARFVQAIHTAKYNIGTSVNVGHQDFFPSGGGSPQPGCIVPLLQSGLDLLSPFCSHYAAIEYFRYSLNSSNVFRGTMCENYNAFYNRKCEKNSQALFGVYAEHSSTTTGEFYLEVSDLPPYALD